jgi:hypothetical protein
VAVLTNYEFNLDQEREREKKVAVLTNYEFNLGQEGGDI